MSTSSSVALRIQPWKACVCAAVCGFLALAAATQSLRTYHWFLLLAIPAVAVAAERGRSFVVGWAPLFLFWIAYDRLRLIQPMLFDRVAVVWPYELERLAFGWLAGGQTPPHAAHAWLTASAGSLAVDAVRVAAEVVYVSHIFVYPLLFLVWWLRGLRRDGHGDRERFAANVRAFTVLNVAGLLCYVLVPAAPPWWVTLNGFAQPTAELVAHADLAAAMSGTLIQKTIATAPQWFAAIPSLHGGYPVLLLLVNRESARPRTVAAVAAYGVAIWISTVLLNQHYVIDLVAGAVLAALAWLVAGWWKPAAQR
jgi:inositol phosphorylceramide synthase catalytic subunit